MIVINNNECNSGVMETAFDFTVQNNGIATKADCPYKEKGGTCNADPPPAASVTGYENIPQNESLP